MGWRGRGSVGPWPGRGPYADLPPWERPGWIYGRGACWYTYAPNRTMPPIQPQDEATVLTQQKAMIEEQLKAMQDALKKIQERLDALKE